MYRSRVSGLTFQCNFLPNDAEYEFHVDAVTTT
jgi:hypothetical protein